MSAGLMKVSAIDVFTVYLPVLGLERGLYAGAVSLLLVVRALTSLVSRVLLEPMVNRFGVNRVLTGTIAIAVVSMGAVRLIGWIPLLVAVMVPFGLGLGLAQPINMAWVAALAAGGVLGVVTVSLLVGGVIAKRVDVVDGSGKAPWNGAEEHLVEQFVGMKHREVGRPAAHEVQCHGSCCPDHSAGLTTFMPAEPGSSSRMV